MKIKALLKTKGSFVATVDPDTTVTDVLAALAHHRVGALVVSADSAHVDGVVSERDIVRRLAATGPAVLDDPVASIMSSEVHCCAPEDQLESLRDVMTEHRIRHVPVLDNGILVGIVSIGDVVKARVDELEDDRRALNEYITAR